jgi:uncharacterized protein YegP (UPF0339 family)
MKPQFEITKGNKDWRFLLRASNGKVLLQSEGYNRKSNAVDGARSIVRAVTNAGCQIKEM